MNSETVILKSNISNIVIDDAGTVTGIAWPFGSPDSDGDVIEKGAFGFSNTVPMMLEHQGQAVGIWETFAETDKGLEVKGRLHLDAIDLARSVRRQLKAGVISGLSIRFRPHDSEPRPEGGHVFKSITVTEISLCRSPVHPGARVTIIKAKENRMEDEIENAPEVEKADPVIDPKEFKALKASVDELVAKSRRPRVANDNHPAGDNDNEVRKAFATYLRYGNQTSPDVLKALTVSSDPQAGYLAPAEVSTEFIRDLVEFSPIRHYASVRTTGSPSVKYPRRTGITNAQWEDELEESEESSVSFGMLEVPVRKITTFVDISNELLADSAGAAEAEVRQALAEDFGQKEAVAFVNGNGVKQPEGVMSNTGIAFTVNGHATNLSADKLIDLMYALPATYRNAAGAAWAMNGTTLAAVRKLKDGQNNYLWQPSYQAGQPETILGKPVIEMVDMPDIGDGKFPIIFGDFSAYRIVDRLALSTLSDPYTQARRGVTRIHATRRTGGRVLQAARFRKLKTSAA